MKRISSLAVAQSKAESFVEPFMKESFRQAAELRSTSALAGVLHSSKTVVHLSERCLERLSLLEQGLIRIFVGELGHKLDISKTTAAIDEHLHNFYEAYKAKFLNSAHEGVKIGQERILANTDARVAAARGRIKEQLQIACQDAERSAPRFWQRNKDAIIVTLITSAITGLLGFLFGKLSGHH